MALCQSTGCEPLGACIRSFCFLFHMRCNVLVLSQTVNHGFVIKTRDGLVRVKILESGNQRVRIGFDADKAIAIDRDEVYERKNPPRPAA